jgi:hypothetical protein
MEKGWLDLEQIATVPPCRKGATNQHAPEFLLAVVPATRPFAVPVDQSGVGHFSSSCYDKVAADRRREAELLGPDSRTLHRRPF